MKFQFVEFYPIAHDENSKHSKNVLGTVHIYVVDCKLDIRGIKVSRKANRLFFHFPHMTAIDEETKEKVRFPVLRFMDDTVHKGMIDFLMQEVKPIVLERINGKPEKKEGFKKRGYRNP